MIGLPRYRIGLDHIPTSVFVYHARCLVFSRVGNVNSNVFLTILNSYGSHITLTRRVTGNRSWRKVSPVSIIAWPVTIGNFTSDVINSCVTEDLSNLLRGCDLVSVRILNLNSPRNGLVQVTIVSAINRLLGRSLTIAWHWISVGDLTVVVLNSYLSIRSAVTSKGNRLWHYLTISQFPTSWYRGISGDRLIGLTSNRVSLNRVAIAINVYHVRCLVVSRVSNVNSNVFLTISNGYCINLSLRNSITSMNWCIIFSPVCSICWPVSVRSYITRYFINGCITEDLSSLRNLLSSLAWFMNRDRPRNRLIQIFIMSTLDLLARRCLVTWLYRIVMRNTLSAVFNGNRNISCWRTSKFNRLWCIMLSLN